MTAERIRLLCDIGRPPGTSPMPTKEKSPGRDAIQRKWEESIPAILVALLDAREATGQPLSWKDVLAILRKSPPKGIPPLRKRELLQALGHLRSLGDGLWEITSSPS